MRARNRAAQASDDVPGPKLVLGLRSPSEVQGPGGSGIPGAERRRVLGRSLANCCGAIATFFAPGLNGASDSRDVKRTRTTTPLRARAMPRRPLPRCPNPECQDKPTTYVKHSKLKSKRRLQRRYRCLGCERTFSANSGTPYHRMRHPAKLFDQVVALAVEGNPRAAIARALGVSVSTVGRWIHRASAHAEAFSDAKIKRVNAVEIQSDELKVLAVQKSKPLWAYTGVEVWSRLWLNTVVGRRTLRNTLLHIREMRWRCCQTGPKILISTDGFKYYGKTIPKVFGPTCVYGQVDKRYKEGRVVRANRRLVLGAPLALEEALSRSEDSKTINTSFVERLNLTIRRGLACLQRKTTAVCRSELSLRGQLELLRCYYNFIRPHSSLRFGRVRRTPAQQAGLVPKRISWREVFTARLLGTPGIGYRSRMRGGTVSLERLAEWS